jgi:DamX protein
MAEVVLDQPAGLPNPFASPAPTFFERGERKSHLEKLRYPSQWSRRVVLVTGSRGVGKSALYRQLSASLEPRAKGARINGSLVNGAREVLGAIVNGFGLAAPADSDTQLLQEIVSEYAHDQEQADRCCAVLVDDADLLEPRALEQLVALASRSPLRVVMFGEVRLVRAVERLAGLLDVGWQEIRLTGFTAEEVRVYLEWRFSGAGYHHRLPFSDAQVKDLARLSDGLPGRLDQMANVLMSKILKDRVEGLARRFPRQHAALLAVLVLVLTLVYLLQPDREPTPARDGAIAVERIDLPAASGEPVGGEPPVDAASDQVSIAEPPAEPVRAVPAPTPAPAPAPANPTVRDAVVSAPQSPAAKPPPAAQPPAATAPVVAPAARPVAPAASGGPKDARWVMSQPATAFTVQLVSLSSPERAQQYMASQPEPGRFATYRLQRDGRILHVVLYGSFATREQAEAAVRLLPDSIGAVQPWIRTFAQVQETARSAIQQ